MRLRVVVLAWMPSVHVYDHADGDLPLDLIFYITPTQTRKHILHVGGLDSIRINNSPRKWWKVRRTSWLARVWG